MDLVDRPAAVRGRLVDDLYMRQVAVVLCLPVAGLGDVLVVGGEGGLAVRAPVGVLGVDDAEDVGVRVVLAVGQGAQGAGAAGGGGLRVAVAVVADDEGDLHPGAVDGAVLRIGHGHAEGDRGAEVVDAAVGGGVDAHGRGRVADGDPHGRRGRLAGGSVTSRVAVYWPLAV